MIILRASVSFTHKPKGRYSHLDSKVRLNSKRPVESNDNPYVAYQREVEPPAKNDEPMHVPFEFHNNLDDVSSLQRSRSFFELMNMRRSLRFYDNKSFPLEVLMNCIQTAGTAPSGAHQQPWHFVVIKSAEVKKQLRSIVEREEQLNYDERMKKSWVKDVTPMVGKTTLYQDGVVQKPYLEEAPYVVVLFEQVHGIDPSTGKKLDHYYVKQSVGIAAGLFIAALTNVGLFSLQSTPLNANEEIRLLLGRPENERVFLLMPVGYPAHNAMVPYRSDDTVPLRKYLSSITSLR